MSKNAKIRAIAEKLPEVPKLHKGKVQFDPSGRVIMMNHFRELNQIYKANRNNPELINELCGQYVQICWELDMRKKELIKDAVRQRNIYVAAIMGLIIIGIAALANLGVKLFNN